ncbi:hypothetical protein [Streptomyces asiaticus]|uniref:hypothetical protein n=1 Tax=Streptomyces asiaticus TaxID=114695 RepID=UPI003F6675A8
MNTGRRIAVIVTAATLAGSLSASLPALAEQGGRHEHSGSVSAPITTRSNNSWTATISASYLNAHGKKWVSKTFTPSGGGITAGWRCWNNHDGGKARIRIYNVETRKYIEGSSKYQKCNGHFKAVTGDGYRGGEGIRFVLQSKGKAHTTDVLARHN